MPVVTTYRLHLESGPMKKKTLVHVPSLLGCVVSGPTTAEAVAAAPDAIRAYLRFLARHGEKVSTSAPFETEIAEHILQGEFVGNGSSAINFSGDLEPVSDADAELYLARFRWMREELADWAAAQPVGSMDGRPASGGRANRAILLHILAVPGPYLSAALGGAPGFSRIGTLAERGDMPLPQALIEVAALVEDTVRATTPEQRAAVREKANGDRRTLRKALRRVLEHDWEHLMELSRRPGGPSL
jgi:predicted RNase H-like HicB family nuclease